MTTKTCEKCGWVLAIQDPLKRCPICKTKFKYGICRICGQPVELYRERNCCKHCYDTVTRTPNDRMQMVRRRRELYKEWCEMIAEIPKNYPTLTEEQWLAAVKHFGGCALCKSDSIDARGYFIPLKDGGRYCDWNIIPICEKCALKNKTAPYFSDDKRPAGLHEIVDYLEEKINAARSTGNSK